jgi:hypothetical protein
MAARTTGPEAAPNGAGATTWCEILPLTQAGDRLLYLHPSDPNPAGRPTWWVPLAPGQPPTPLVGRTLAQALDGQFDPATAVVHSTSWRYDPEPGAVVLTYLALLPTPGRPSVPSGFATTAVDHRQPATADHRAPPRAIEIGDVVAHGLRHFALLRTTDPAIAATLPPHWHACLAPLSPLPAGQLNGHPPARRRPRLPPGR